MFERVRQWISSWFKRDDDRLGPNQRAWVEALESGEYKQHNGALEGVKGGYCCLGVACLVAEQHGVPVYREDGRLPGGYCPEEVQDWLRLRTHNGAPCGVACEQLHSLTHLNDVCGLSLGRIGREIRKFPEAYFACKA